jgi:hypothetical protein
MSELAGRELQRHNRRVLAERLRWPDGTLETCEELEQEHPAWHVFWGDDEPAWTAWHYERRRFYRNARGATVAELVANMAEQDRLAAEQRAEWARWRPYGWSTARVQ